MRVIRRGSPGSLRGRLTLGTMLLLAGGLLAGHVTAFIAVSSFLGDRVDRNLEVVADRARESAAQLVGETVTPGTIERLMPSDSYVALYDSADRTLLMRDTREETMGGIGVTPPVGPDPITVGADLDGGLRVVRIDLPTEQPLLLQSGATTSQISHMVVGISRADDAATLRRLIRVESLSGLTILLTMLLASRLVLRSGLAPLRSVADTAREIGRGDLGRRLVVGDPSTEIGAVSAALNTAFDQREASEERLRRFVADASHELRTPLSTIHGWADLYVSGGIDDWEGVDAAMSNIRTESHRMGHLVDQLLTLARLDAHEPLHETDVDLNALCAQAIADFAISIRSHPVRIVGADDVRVTADADALRRIVDNLLGNALHHTPAGTPIDVHVATLTASSVGLTVVDHGPGLGDEQRMRAFDRFWRADSQRSAPGGTGLGLSITRDLVMAHGGSISLLTTPGGGLTVEVELPR